MVVGVSGGPDSSALFDSLRHAGQRTGFRVHAAHLIHDFRGQEKYDDADFVRQLCAGTGLTVEEVDVAEYQRQHSVSSFEQAARDLRYAFLARVAGEVDAGWVAVAHTRDDQAETVLLHIARGSGLHGLRGMGEIGDWPYPAADPPRLWRPLLRVSRADTIGYCREVGIECRDDTTNYMQDFARNRVRMQIMPAMADALNPRIADALNRLSRTVASQLDYLESHVDAAWPDVAPEPLGSDGALRLHLPKLAGMHPALRDLILRRTWLEVTGDAKRLTEQNLNQMASMVGRGASGKTVGLPGGYVAHAQGRWLVIAPGPLSDDCPYPHLSGEFRVTLPFGPIAVAVTKRDGWEVTTRSVTVPGGASLDTGDPMSARLSREALNEGATARPWSPGDRMQPLGMAGHRKLQDVFTDAGVPKHWRDRVPLVATPNGIAWAVGVRIADWAAVGGEPDQDREAILLQFRLEPTG